MNCQEPPPFGPKSLARWLALGFLGIGLAVAIALVARNLADQPVGIAGEPVSAGRALDPPRNSASGNGSGGADTGRGPTGSKNVSPGGGSNAAPASGTGSGGDRDSGGSDEDDDGEDDDYDNDDD